MRPDFFIVWVDQGRSGISDARKPRIRYFPLWCGSYRFIRHGHAPPGSMSGSLKTILRGSTSRVNLPNAQSNDCGRSSTNDGNGNAASCDLSSGSLNAPPRLWQLPYTKLSPWMAPQWGQTPARYSHPIDFEYFGRTPQFTSSKRRNAWDKTAVRNIRCGIIPHLIFPVVGSFFSLSLRSPMVMIRFPGVVLLLGFF